MGYTTQIGLSYKVTGKNVFAFDNYVKPQDKNPHDRGYSAGAYKFSLENKIITVTEHVYRTEEGGTSKPGVFAPFEIVKVTVENHEGEYYARVVNEGEEKIEEIASGAPVTADNSTVQNEPTPAPKKKKNKSDQNEADPLLIESPQE